MSVTLDILQPRKSAWVQVCEDFQRWADVDRTKTPQQMLREDPCLIFKPLGEPDPWQKEVLTCKESEILLLCSRQAGKSQTMAAMSLLEALTYAHSEVLILSRSLRQSVELLRKVKELWRGLTGGKINRRRTFAPKTLSDDAKGDKELVGTLGWDGAALIGDDFKVGVREKALSHDFPNGSRITSLPGNPDTIVGFSAVTLLIVDEAARVKEDVMHVARPFLTVTEAVHGRPGRTVVASTPFGKRGWFYDACKRCEEAKLAGKTPPWKLVQVTAAQCPRITQEFLDRERAELGDRWFMQEYFTQFVDAMGSVFSHDLIQAALVETESGPMKLWFE